eukprot:GHVQ01021177.1.p2 GENE.GHVQ01021177.1~~GHVQ01021177.1.p2  ORF type:complete len:404 (-),score=28.15 GHVQ01021177.1:3191-4402(-)
MIIKVVVHVYVDVKCFSISAMLVPHSSGFSEGKQRKRSTWTSLLCCCAVVLVFWDDLSNAVEVSTLDRISDFFETNFYEDTERNILETGKHSTLMWRSPTTIRSRSSKGLQEAVIYPSTSTADGPLLAMTVSDNSRPLSTIIDDGLTSVFVKSPESVDITQPKFSSKSVRRHRRDRSAGVHPCLQQDDDRAGNRCIYNRQYSPSRRSTHRYRAEAWQSPGYFNRSLAAAAVTETSINSQKDTAMFLVEGEKAAFQKLTGDSKRRQTAPLRTSLVGAVTPLEVHHTKKWAVCRVPMKVKESYTCLKYRIEFNCSDSSIAEQEFYRRTRIWRKRLHLSVGDPYFSRYTMKHVAAVDNISGKRKSSGRIVYHKLPTRRVCRKEIIGHPNVCHHVVPIFVYVSCDDL